MKGNTVSVTGNITRDCEVRHTRSGNTVVSWGICWNSSRKNQQGGYDDIPNYFDVQAWVTDAQLRIIESQLVKGARCSITEAHLVYQQWQGQNGNNRSKVLINVYDVIQGMTVRPPQNGSNGAYQQQPNNYTQQPQNGSNGAYQQQPNNYTQQPQNGGYSQPQQGYQQPQQQQMQMANTSVYYDDIPF